MPEINPPQAAPRSLAVGAADPATDPPRPLPWPRLLPALAAGGLLYACYFPVAWGWLGWVALVPLLCLARGTGSRRRLALCAWAGGLVCFVPVLAWMRVADIRMYATWLLLASYCSLFFPAGVLLVRTLDRRTRLPLSLTVPLVWVALEYFRSHVGTGFGWYLLGHTQHDFLPVIQVTDLGGVYAVTFLVAAVNGLVFELLSTRGRFRALFALAEPGRLPPRPRLALQAAAVVALVAASLGYGGWRLSQDDFRAGPRVALVQGNLDLRLKNEAWSSEPGAQTASQAMRMHHTRLTDLAVRHRPELVVWPETSWPDEWVEMVREGEVPVPVAASEGVEELVRLVSGRWKTDVLSGMNAVVATADGRERRYNSAVLVSADGSAYPRYDKIHCVPFGEYVPFRDWLPWMEVFSPYDFDYSVRPGERLTRFPAGQHHFGVLICYEDTVSYLARRYARPGGDGPAADFLVNASNDGWFDGTPEHEEHLAVCRFRAIEARRSVARAVNMGISAVIDPNGRVLAPATVEEEDDARVWEVPASAPALPVRRWSEFKKVPGVLLASPPIDGRGSPYARWGDWLPWACWAALAAGLAVAFVRRRATGASGS
jgi:apolipoprotein N-acyltransferase